MIDESKLSPTGRLALKAALMQGERDFEGLRALSAPDVVLEFPFHPNGPEEHHGVDAFISTISVLKVFETFTIWAEAVYDNGGDEILIEGRSRGTYRSGRPPYENHYIFALTFKDGKLTRWREFFNPVEAMKQNYGVKRAEKEG